MRVLHVVDRVFVVLFECQIDIEHEFRIGLARHQEKAHGVASAAQQLGRLRAVVIGARAVIGRIGQAARPFDQVAHGDVAAGALGNLHLLAVAHHGHHLVQHVVGIADRNADPQALQTGAHARDGAVVVGTLDVDHLGIAALPFGHVVGDVGHEIGVRAVGFTHHAILVVAVVGGAQPQRAVLLVGTAGRDQGRDSALDATFRIERRLQVIAIEFDAEGLQVTVLFAAQIGDREAADRFQIVKRLRAGHRFAVAGGDRCALQVVLGDIADVVAVVGAFRPECIAGLQAACARLHR